MGAYFWAAFCAAVITEACLFGQVILNLRKLAEDAERREVKYMRLAEEMRIERDAVKVRYDAKRDHYCLIREAENEQLQQELEVQKHKYQVLEIMLNQK